MFCFANWLFFGKECGNVKLHIRNLNVKYSTENDVRNCMCKV
jgi:hypothetical protein